MATIEDVVRVSGASRSTVFRFLNGSNVRPEVKKAILEAMEKLDYKSDAIYKQKDITVEISVSENYEGFKGFAEVVQGITQRAEEKGIKVNICRRTGRSIEEAYSKCDAVSNQKGVIIIGKNIEDEEKESDIIVSKGIPHIFVNRVIEKSGISYVAVDLRKAAHDAVSHLIKLGHEKIGVIGVPGSMRVDRDKMEGYKDALQENGIKVSNAYFREVDSMEDWEANVRSMLGLKERPTAYFGICDSHAMKFIHIARSMGYKVPADIAVVGMDNVETAEYFRPSITSIHVPFKKMGILAVDHLLQLITDDEVVCLKTVINHRLVVRESCNSGGN